MPAAPESERVEDRHPHIRHRNLRQDGPVYILHQRVHRRLRMHRNPHLVPVRTSNSRHASMISSPLFSMVAESMVIRRPITHVGCFNACSGVIRAYSARGVVRDGPPEAVSQIVLISACAPTRMHWCTALCSLSMGRIGTLRSRAAAVRISLAVTMHSLLASPMGLPARIAACVASSPATPDNRRDHEVRFGMCGAGYRSFRSPNDFNPGRSCLLQQGVPTGPPGLPSPGKLPSAAIAPSA